MREIILDKLREIEEQNDVKILYAVEAGSRGWGLESYDSDYDVRFIYIHKPEWYLSIKEKRDVIELPINDILDINGWDLRKTLLLFKKSNPTLLEWLSSPIVYGESTGLVDEMRELLKEYFSSKSCIYHYLHMAESNYKTSLRCEEASVKRYLNIVRPLMACMWVEKFGTQAPMEFEELLNTLNFNKELLDEIQKLVIIKRNRKEIDSNNQLGILKDFIKEKIRHFNEYVRTINVQGNEDIDTLDQLFRRILEEAWREEC